MSERGKCEQESMEVQKIALEFSGKPCEGSFITSLDTIPHTKGERGAIEKNLMLERECGGSEGRKEGERERERERERGEMGTYFILTHCILSN